MIEMSAEATVEVMKNLLKHGRMNIVMRNALENAVRLLGGVEAEVEGDCRNGYWDVCGECHGVIERTEKYCHWCGKKIIWEKGEKKDE